MPVQTRSMTQLPKPEEKQKQEDQEEKQETSQKKQARKKQDKTRPIITKISKNDILQYFVGYNSPEVAQKYPKVHPTTGERLYRRGYYWKRNEPTPTSTKQASWDVHRGYERDEFYEIDKEYINIYDKNGYLRIVRVDELDILITANLSKDDNDSWALAPPGYYWKYYSEKCYYSFDWFELEPIPDR